MNNTRTLAWSSASLFSALLLLFTANVIAAEHQIKMLNKGSTGQMVFEPAVLQVAVGDKITFIPTDPEHDAISVLTPLGANSWHGQRGK